MAVYDMTDRELLHEYLSSGTYDPEICAEMCKRTGLEDEWNAADGDNFEDVVSTAAAKLTMVHWNDA